MGGPFPPPTERVLRQRFQAGGQRGGRSASGSRSASPSGVLEELEETIDLSSDDKSTDEYRPPEGKGHEESTPSDEDDDSDEEELPAKKVGQIRIFKVNC